MPPISKYSILAVETPAVHKPGRHAWEAPEELSEDASPRGSGAGPSGASQVPLVGSTGGCAALGLPPPADHVTCFGCCPSTPGPILAGFRYRPFPLLERELLTAGGPGTPSIIRLTFGLAEAGGVLGVGQPCTAVKVRPPGFCFRSRTYSIASAPARRGSFQIIVKLYPGGVVSGYLGQLQVGHSAWMARTRTKSLVDDPKYVGIVAFGVGIADVVHTAAAMLEGGAAEVKVLYATRAATDAVLTEDLQHLEQRFPARFTFEHLLSREDPPEGFANARYGRVDKGTLEGAFGRWAAADAHFLVVGTRAMISEVHADLRALGFTQRLMGHRGL